MSCQRRHRNEPASIARKVPPISARLEPERSKLLRAMFLLGVSRRTVLSKCEPNVAKRLAVRLERAHEIVRRVAANLKEIGSAGS